jgi:hypothetical protein
MQILEQTPEDIPVAMKWQELGKFNLNQEINSGNIGFQDDYNV